MCDFTSEDIKTDCTAIRIWKDLVFIGIGCFLYIYNSNTLEQVLKTKVFEYQKLRGIEFSSTENVFLFVHGENKGAKYRLCLENGVVLVLVNKCTLLDWILAAKWLNHHELAIVSMQNKLSILDENLNVNETIGCPQKCIVYSALIHKAESDFIIFSGTVFSEIIVWFNDKILHRLKGHKGVIFSLDYNERNRYLCSTSDDRTAILWKCDDSFSKIDMIAMLNGHTARVFKCKVFDTVVVTCGEDSIANVWNFHGRLFRTIEGNQGDSLWSIDGNEDDNYFVIGGGDSNVIKHSIHVKLTEIRLSLPITKEIPKKVAISRQNNVIVVSESGNLYYYVFVTNTWQFVAFHLDLKKYVIMELSKCKNLVALAGYSGEIYIYKEYDGMQLVAKCVSPQKARIYSLNWLHCNGFVTCSESGIVSTWIIAGNDLILNDMHILPKSSERWTTAAAIVDDYLTVGDRKGNLFFYKFNDLHPRFSVKKAHNYLGITDITTFKGHVYSLGRNSCMRKFSVVDDALIPIYTDKLPFNWLTRYLPEEDVILAFSGANFVVWNLSRRCRVLKYNCQGGHRSWDFNTNDECSKFVYLRDKHVNVLLFNLSALIPKTLAEGYHSWEVNVVKRINNLLISGGEDTTMRIMLQNDEYKLRMVHCLKSHLSSIRTIETCLIRCETNVETYYVLSGGGRAQIILWQIKYDVKSADVQCLEKHSYYECIGRDDSEMRIMDIAVYKTEDALYVFAACSDGLIKIFRIDFNEERLILLKNVKYKLKCIMKIDVIQVEERLIMLTGSVNGLLNIWDVTFVTILTTSSFKEDVSPFYVRRLHKSGINSMSCFKLIDTRYVLLTGGDDATIRSFLLDFDVKEIVLDGINLDDEHCTQVSGAIITNEYFITCSTDGKVVVLDWSLQRDVNRKEDYVSTEFVSSYYTSVADLKGLIYNGNDLILYGKGIELVRVKFKERN